MMVELKLTQEKLPPAIIYEVSTLPSSNLTLNQIMECTF